MDELVGDRVLATPVLEPIGLLGYAAALTDRVRLGVAVLVLPRHNPVALAKSLAGLDRLSSGRLIVGIGLGEGKELPPTIGIPTDRPVRRVTEGLAVMRALWTEPEASYRGELWQLDHVAMEPKPLQEPSPPIWLGGGHPDALRRAARLADGWVGAGASSGGEFRKHAEGIRGALEREGRDPGSFVVSKRVYVAVDGDSGRARKKLAEFMNALYGDAELAGKVSVYGRPEACAEAFGELVEAGAQHLILNPVYDHLEQTEALAEITAPLRLES